MSDFCFKRRLLPGQLLLLMGELRRCVRHTGARTLSLPCHLRALRAQRQETCTLHLMERVNLGEMACVKLLLLCCEVGRVPHGLCAGRRDLLRQLLLLPGAIFGQLRVQPFVVTAHIALITTIEFGGCGLPCQFLDALAPGEQEIRARRTDARNGGQPSGVHIRHTDDAMLAQAILDAWPDAGDERLFDLLAAQKLDDELLTSSLKQLLPCVRFGQMDGAQLLVEGGDPLPVARLDPLDLERFLLLTPVTLHLKRVAVMLILSVARGKLRLFRGLRFGDQPVDSRNLLCFDLLDVRLFVRSGRQRTFASAPPSIDPLSTAADVAPGDDFWKARIEQGEVTKVAGHHERGQPCRRCQAGRPHAEQ